MSQVWMMWLDGDSQKLAEEVVFEAVEYYQGKYGARPNKLQVPLDFPEVDVEGIRIERLRNVLEDHLLLTVDLEESVREGRGEHAR